VVSQRSNKRKIVSASVGASPTLSSSNCFRKEESHAGEKHVLGTIGNVRGIHIDGDGKGLVGRRKRASTTEERVSVNGSNEGESKGEKRKDPSDDIHDGTFCFCFLGMLKCIFMREGTGNADGSGFVDPLDYADSTCIFKLKYKET
jgi:hypothetical protein